MCYQRLKLESEHVTLKEIAHHAVVKIIVTCTPKMGETEVVLIHQKKV